MNGAGRRWLPCLLLALLPAAAITAADAVPTPAQRVITLAPHLAELSCAAGGCARLVAVSAWSDFPASVAQLPVIGDGWQIDLERVLALRPDLVLAWDGGTPPEAIARLRRLGLRVEALPAARLDGVADALLAIGGWLGTEAAAGRAADAYRARLARQRARAARLPTPPLRVVYQIETAPAWTVNGDSAISEAIALCGGRNVFAAQPKLALSVSAEAMLAADPDVVLHGDDEDAAALARYWARLGRAQADGGPTLIAIDADRLGRPGPRLLDGVDEVCTRLDAVRAARR